MDEKITVRCNAAMMNLTEQEMIELWKLRLGLTQARRDCTIEREDGIDVDARLLTDIRKWYAHQLATASVHLLPVEDFAGSVFADVATDGSITVQLPDRCVRPVCWHVEGWSRDVVTYYSPDSVVARQQAVEWLRGNEARPVAVLADNELKLYSIPPGAGGDIDKARCVAYPADGSYQFGAELLSTIKDLPY